MKTILCLCVIDNGFIGLSGKSAMALLSDRLGVNVTEDTLFENIKNSGYEDVELTISTPFEYFQNMLGRLGKDEMVVEAKEFYDCNNGEDFDDWPYMAEMNATNEYVFVVVFDNDMM